MATEAEPHHALHLNLCGSILQVICPNTACSSGCSCPQICAGGRRFCNISDGETSKIKWLIFVGDLLLQHLKTLLHLLLLQQQSINVLLLLLLLLLMLLLLLLQTVLQVRNLRLSSLFDQPVLIPAPNITQRANENSSGEQRWLERTVSSCTCHSHPRPRAVRA